METPPPPTVTTFKPDPTKNTRDNLYEIFYRGSNATPAEIAYYNANRPSDWTAWATGDNTPADPAQQQPQQQTPPAPQQQQPAPNPVPPTFDVTKFDGHTLAVTSDEKASKIIADIAKLSQSLDDAAHATFENERRRLLDSGVGVDEANTVAKKLADQQQSEQRAALYQKNEKNLLAAIKELQAAEQTAADYARTFNCLERPVTETLLTLHALGTAERQNYVSQLANAHPGALKAAAQLARMTNNATLAAVVFIENGKLVREQRTFANEQLADHFYGKRAVEIHNAAAVTRSAVQSAMLSLRELSTGRTTATSLGKISLGVAKTKAKFKAPAEPSPDKPLGDDHHLSKIRAGLDQLANNA